MHYAHHCGGTGSPTIVRADTFFGFSNHSARLSTIFTILPLPSIHNRRSAIILGQGIYGKHGGDMCSPIYVSAQRRKIILKRMW